MTPRTFLFSTLFIVFTSFTQLLAQVGDTCSLKHTRAPGVCKLAADCPKVKELALKGISPVICGFQDLNIPIVCCESAYVPNDNTFFEIDSEVPDNRPTIDNNQGSNLRISERKCQDYSQLTTQSVSAIVLISNPKPVTINITNCEFNGVPLIYGGQPALQGEFPFMAAVGFRSGDSLLWLCGGSLISERYVMTAAHCTVTRYGSAAMVMLGDISLNSNKGVQIPVVKIETHPNYTRPIKYNDIALLRLAEKVDFNTNIRPACLWTKYNVNQATAIATGWGKTDTGAPSNILRKVQLDVFDNNLCRSVYEVETNLPNGISDSMLCAGELKGEKDTCQGDSGGPLVIAKEGNLCVHYVIGVTSFGKHCATAQIPAIYTRVAEYLRWIESIVW